ncbi:hypothetical protein A2U01_0065148, partial [Trifolium medium]|nr:hypothetical protein [Trifolium medium]
MSGVEEVGTVLIDLVL